MSQQLVFRRLTAATFTTPRARTSAAIRYSAVQQASRYATALPSLSQASLYSTGLPSITQASFWESLIPKPLRRHGRLKTKKPKSKEWNPATFFIIILLLIGSMSIQMIALKNDFAAFMRRSDAKIDLLREVIQKVQNGEEVDVEGLLGTGDVEKEKEWEEVLKEIEQEDELWTAARKKKPVQRTPVREEQDAAAAAAPDAPSKVEADATKAAKPTSRAPAGFF